jgi:hypothetical protein
MVKKMTTMEKEKAEREKKHGKAYKPSKKEYMQEAARDRKLEKQKPMK